MRKDDEKKKAYIYQIVSNTENSIDVDKWDYLCRDPMYCGMNERFLSERAILGARVVLTSKTGEPPVHQIGYPEKDALMFYNMFQTRFTLHRYVYQHRVIVSMNLMVKDIFQAYDSDVRMQGCETLNINPYPLKKTTKIPDEDEELDSFIESNTTDYETDMYMELTDHIISPFRIRQKENGSLTGRPVGKAIELTRRIDNRNFYKIHRELHLKRGIGHDEAKKTKEDCIKSIQGDNRSFPENIAVVLISFDYDMVDNNPMDRVIFYNKRIPGNEVTIRSGDLLPKHKVSHLLTDVFSDYYIRIYVKTGDIAENIKQTVEELVRRHDTGSGEAEILYRRHENMAGSGITTFQ